VCLCGRRGDEWAYCRDGKRGRIHARGSVLTRIDCHREQNTSCVDGCLQKKVQKNAVEGGNGSWKNQEKVRRVFHA